MVRCETGSKFTANERSSLKFSPCRSASGPVPRGTSGVQVRPLSSEKRTFIFSARSDFPCRPRISRRRKPGPRYWTFTTGDIPGWVEGTNTARLTVQMALPDRLSVGEPSGLAAKALKIPTAKVRRTVERIFDLKEL